MDFYEKIRTLPTHPGVYLYKNAEGEVIYVGKAKNLRSRVRSYLLEASQANAKTGSLMREAVDLDYILVANEHEALALENNLIKQRHPRFNILLRDDKTYPYVKLTLADRFPKVFVTRRIRKDGAAYYGPYFPGNLAYRIVELIHRSFLIPSCKVDLSRYHPRACLQYYIHRCLGPCVEGLTTPETYANAVRDAQLFLEGRAAELERSLTARMMAAAEAEQFEAAARLRDQLSTVHQLQEKQRIATAEEGDDADVFGYHFEAGSLAVNLFHVRAGKIVDRREFFWDDLPELLESPTLEQLDDSSDDRVPLDLASETWEASSPPPHSEPPFHAGPVFSALLKQLYIDQHYVPRTILVPADFDDREALAALLTERTGHRIELAVPQRGEKRSLVDLAGQNAKQSYIQRFRVLEPSRKAIQEALADALMLPELPTPHRVLRHLPHPGRGDRGLAGRLGRRQDEQAGLSQIQGEDRPRRGRFRLHARGGRRAAIAACRKKSSPCLRWCWSMAGSASFTPPPKLWNPLGLDHAAAGVDCQTRRGHLSLRQRGGAGGPRPPLAGSASGPAHPRREPSLCRRLSSPAPRHARPRLRAVEHSRRRRANPPATTNSLRQPARRAASHGRIAGRRGAPQNRRDNLAAFSCRSRCSRPVTANLTRRSRLSGSARERSAALLRFLSGSSHKLPMTDGNALAARLTAEFLGVGNAADRGAAPRAFPFQCAEPDQRADERRKDAGDNHGNAEKRAKAGEAHQSSGNDKDRSCHHAEEQPAEPALEGPLSGSTGAAGIRISSFHSAPQRGQKLHGGSI